jgi:hypothetical protein
MLTSPFNIDQYGVYRPPTRQELIESTIRQQLLTPLGSHPVFIEVGSKAHRLSFLNQGELTSALAQQWTEEALVGLIEGVDIISVEVSYETLSDAVSIIIKVWYEDTLEGITNDITITLGGSA